MTLKNKTILITGSTRGIGKAIAISCLENNANVIIHGSKKETVETIVSELQKKFSSHITGIAADLSTNENCQNLINHVI